MKPSTSTINIIERRQNVSDVWCGSYAEHSFVLGMSFYREWRLLAPNVPLGMTNQLWFVPDLDNLQSARTVRMGSDALSLARNEVCMSKAPTSFCLDESRVSYMLGFGMVLSMFLMPGCKSDMGRPCCKHAHPLPVFFC